MSQLGTRDYISNLFEVPPPIELLISLISAGDADQGRRDDHSMLSTYLGAGFLVERVGLDEKGGVGGGPERC